MRILLALALVLPVLAPAPVSAGPATASEFSAQRYERPRIRVYPRGGRLFYRDCVFRLVQEWRPSGTVIVPRQRCWWVRG